MSTPADTLTDAQLLHHIRAGDTAAYDVLYRRHVSDARRVARAVTHDQAEADEVVADAFATVLARAQDATGPDQVLAPYLRTLIRRIALDGHRPDSGPLSEPAPASVLDDSTPGDANPAVVDDLPTAGDHLSVADRNVTREAYETLPERWQRVLWLTEIEGHLPGALVPTLGSTADAVAALAYRAREGLRQAYLAVHLSGASPDECRPFVSKLPPYLRESLPPDDDVAVAVHLDLCSLCRGRRYELSALVSNLRGVLAPALLGYSTGQSAVAAGALATAGTVAAGTTATLAGPAGGAVGTASSGPGVRRRRLGAGVRVAATTLVSAAAAVLVAYVAVSAMGPTVPADEVGQQQAIAAGHAPATSAVSETTGDTMPSAVTATPNEAEDSDNDDGPLDEPSQPSITEAAGAGAAPSADPQDIGRSGEPPAGPAGNADSSDDSTVDPAGQDTQQPATGSASSPARPPASSPPDESAPPASSPPDESEPPAGSPPDDPGETDDPAPPDETDSPSPGLLCRTLAMLPWC